MATFFDIPMTSGKDSMKNDFKAEGVKISVPPTILYSMVSKLDDVRNVVTSDFKTAGDLGLSNWVKLTMNWVLPSFTNSTNELLGANVPKVRKEASQGFVS
jgi:phosphoribosylformylglycinamidine (FGAM) synthase-like enzyme